MQYRCYAAIARRNMRCLVTTSKHVMNIRCNRLQQQQRGCWRRCFLLGPSRGYIWPGPQARAKMVVGSCLTRVRIFTACNFKHTAATLHFRYLCITEAGARVRHRVYSLVTGWTTGSNSRQGQVFFLFSQCRDHIGGPQNSHPVHTRSPFPEGKAAQKHEADHSR
jgi:hypothetical protein